VAPVRGRGRGEADDAPIETLASSITIGRFGVKRHDE
jgi:hypothetical protein